MENRCLFAKEVSQKNSAKIFPTEASLVHTRLDGYCCLQASGLAFHIGFQASHLKIKCL